MDLFTLALVSHMDATPANMDLFAFVGINNVDAAREGNIDKWLIAAISVLSRSLSLFSPIWSFGAGVAVLCLIISLRVISAIHRLSIQQFIQRHAIQRGERNKVIG